MGTGRATGIAILLLTVPAITVIATANDPGPGDDAPDTFPKAHAVASEGTYNGALTPNGDADWLSLPDAELSLDGDVACMRAAVAGADALSAVHATLLGSGNQTVDAQLNPDHDPSIGLADANLERAVVGLEPIRGDQSTGNWSLTFDSLGVTDLDGDAGTGAQAPALDASEEPFTVPSACFGGSLLDGETSDAYRLGADTSQKLALSAVGVQSTDLDLTVYGPDGEPRASVPATEGGPVEIVDIDTAGTWTLEMSGPGDLDTSYFVGASLLYDSDDGCRPYCDTLE